MIDFLRGTIIHIEADYIVMDVHGVGYRVFCANSHSFQSKLNEEQTVFIHHHVREDAILLYGFLTREEQTLFRRLLEVSGIGPRVAVGILSGSQPQAIITAIQHENLNFLVKLPGIGKKTAQRMVLDLKDKLDAIAPSSERTNSFEAISGDSSAMSGHNWSEAKAGLMALGYTETELNGCWSAIRTKIKDTDSIDTVMKLALQALYKG